LTERRERERKREQNAKQQKKRTSKNKNKKIIIPYMNRALKNVRNFYEEQYKPFKDEECVYCPKCFSILLKSEKKLFKSFCCTGGKVTIPKVSETLPEEYKKLFTTPGPTRKCLKKNIITFNSLLSYCSTGFGKNLIQSRCRENLQSRILCTNQTTYVRVK